MTEKDKPTSPIPGNIAASVQTMVELGAKNNKKAGAHVDWKKTQITGRERISGYEPSR